MCPRQKFCRKAVDKKFKITILNPPPIFLTKNGTGGDGTVFRLQNTKNGMERDDRSLLRTEANGTIGKKEQERNNLAEGPRSRTEQNDF